MRNNWLVIIEDPGSPILGAIREYEAMNMTEADAWHHARAEAQSQFGPAGRVRSVIRKPEVLVQEQGDRFTLPNQLDLPLRESDVVEVEEMQAPGGHRVLYVHVNGFTVLRLSRYGLATFKS